MLDAYVRQTQRLLQNPGAPTTLYSEADIEDYISFARRQLAGEAEAIRIIGTIPTVIGQPVYQFSDIDIGVPATTGVDGIFNIQTIQFMVASGQKWLNPRPWPWFQLYALNNPVPQPAEPARWSVFAQGASPTNIGPGQGGTFYIDPPPDQVYTLNCDCTCYPIVLVDDTTPEAIPYPFTDCVPFFAAYWAYLSAQTGARQVDAERMYNHYQTFLERARKQTNASVNRWQYPQAEDPSQAAKFGIKAGGGAG